jgi:hypothetical protein
MKKTFLFFLSISVAFGITFYIKREQSQNFGIRTPEWKTFIKKSGATVASHETTTEEFIEAKINPPKKSLDRQIASIDPMKGFMVRDNRILMGEIDHKYENEDTTLPMSNKINPQWKEIVGKELMRFQPVDTKVMVKEEIPVIKIEEGRGLFLQQISVTYLQKGGFRNSFKALVDSETGSIVTTWDRTIFETKRSRGELTLPSINESGIITK